MRNVNKQTGIAYWVINKTLKEPLQMRLSALRLHWVSAVYLCLLRPLLGWRSADQRERGVNKAKPLTELWAPAVEPTVPSSRDGDRGFSRLATAPARVSVHTSARAHVSNHVWKTSSHTYDHDEKSNR